MPTVDDVLQALERDGWVSEENVPGGRSLCAQLAREGVLVSRLRWVVRTTAPAPRDLDRERRLHAVAAGVERELARGEATVNRLASVTGFHYRDVGAVLTELADCNRVASRVVRGVGRKPLTMWALAPGYEPARIQPKTAAK